MHTYIHIYIERERERETERGRTKERDRKRERYTHIPYSPVVYALPFAGNAVLSQTPLPMRGEHVYIRNDGPRARHSVA